MDYLKCAQILNAHIFDGDKASLIQKVAEYPERYVGLFRPTKPRAKLIQNLLQSHEIRFGDAMESVIREILNDMGYLVFSGETLILEEGALSLDQFFCDREKKQYYFIEQKVRDDHDSTKKQGQISNFEHKLEILYGRYGDQLVGIMYFVDPSLQKNRSFYEEKLKKMHDIYGVMLRLFYGRELFEFFQRPELWDILLDWLQKWREEIPDLPEVNMDIDPAESLEELKRVRIRYWRELLTNDELWEEGIIRVMFPQGDTLRGLARYFMSREATPYRRLAETISERMERYYGNKPAARPNCLR